MRWAAVIIGSIGLLAVLATYILFIYRQRQLFPSTPATADIVCLGDSLTECGGVGGRYSDYLAQALPEYRVLNRGIGGDTLAGGRERFSRDVLSLRPKLVIIELGANDFHRADRPIEALFEDLAHMVNAAGIQGIQVIIAGVFGPQLDRDSRLVPKEYKEGAPQLGQQIFQMEREIARRFGAVHVENIQAELNKPEHWGDPRHPSPAGNRVVAARLLPVVKQLLAEQPR